MYFPYTEQPVVNLGLAHGLPGIGLFLLEQGLETATATGLADYLNAVYKKTGPGKATRYPFSPIASTCPALLITKNKAVMPGVTATWAYFIL